MALNTSLARHRREELGLSLPQLARRLGVTHAALFRWESGETEPRGSDMRKRWAHELGITIEQLYAASNDDAAEPAET